MHGLDDERVPYEMALETATDLRTRGYDVELVGYPGQHHSMSDAEDTRFHSWLSSALTNQAAGRPITDGFVLEP
jgi:dipeptidyl aminopeptidase/acylaminoacyl peptidase